ncbi:lipopolysaccharide heptosyltransferase I [Aquabacter spiritensis]|uniref:Lipopolysaccharide heptosyltransferase 1 n=1 Tax=Aquabacter spiritensis TaxID=933073 RepID=A0A4V6NZF9_9HYPH|nr:lipopolysaccharide heptosyltransferase I [Aquabacter spiritensis]TCT01578.1 heptosyltransferase-1 [Aquabacter spiritensis]
MKVLIVKLSSLGDVVHTFPALSDAARAIPGLVVDWAVEESLVPLVQLHPAVRRAIPVPLRRLRGNPLAAWRSQEGRAVRAALAAERYDAILDAQGLMKSALIATLARGRRHGFAWGSAREGVASLAYGRRYAIPEVEHMAVRIRRLFAAALGYALPDLAPQRALGVPPAEPGTPYLVLLHGTTWSTKTWTVLRWRELAQIAASEGLAVRVFALGEAETHRAQAIARDLPEVEILPPLPLDRLAPILAGAQGVVTVDSGLGHLAAALGVPTLGLYGPTDARLTGLYGPKALELRAFRPCAPCESAHCKIAPHTLEGPPCMVDHAARAAWRALNVLRFGHADRTQRNAAPATR